MVYTAGYQGHTAQELERLALKLDVTIIDIRYSPRSMIPGFSGVDLGRQLGKRYLHMPEFGNLDFKQNKIRINSLEFGERRLEKYVNSPTRVSEDVLLLCACKDYHTCHRKVVSEYLARIGWPTAEVTEDQWAEITTSTGDVALSIWQPWAWLLANRFKDVENRDWRTSHRGNFFIHASQKFDDNGYSWVRYNFPEIEMPEEFEHGGIVGKAEIVACVDQSDSPWFMGKHGFVVQNAQPLPFQKMRGHQKFFQVMVEKS